VKRLSQGLTQLQFLLDHWEEKTIYCNFGEFTNDLLAADKKAELLDAAKKYGLFDYASKSKTMNVMCKRDPQIVRAYAGLLDSDENDTLKKADVLMRKPAVMALVDEDQLDQYLEDVETYTTLYSEVDGLSYQARTDYGSSETRTLAKIKAEAQTSLKKDYLEQTRDSLTKLVVVLGRIVTALKQ